MQQRRLKQWILLTVGAALCGTACSSSAANAPPPNTPAYPGRCVYLGLEEVPGPGDQNSDSVSLVASYRFDEPSVPAHKPLALGFRVERSRVHDLRAHLDQHPTVLCRPDVDAQTPSQDIVDLPPFEGQRGNKVTEPAPP